MCFLNFIKNKNSSNAYLLKKQLNEISKSVIQLLELNVKQNPITEIIENLSTKNESEFFNSFNDIAETLFQIK